MINLGVGTVAEWEADGISQAALRRGVRAGTFIRVRHGWYAHRNAEDLALEAAAKSGAISCISALRRHSIWIPHGPQQLHLRGNGYAHRSRPGRYCTAFGGQPPQPVDSILDDPLTALRHALRCLNHEGITVVCDSLLNTSIRAQTRPSVQEILTPTEVASAFEGAPAEIVTCLQRCDARAASGTETMVRLRLRSKKVDVGVQVHIPGYGHADLLVGERLIIEVDSKAHHIGLAEYAEDRRRDQVAAGRGLLRMRLTYENVVYGWPETERVILAAVHDGHHRAPRRFRHRPRW